VIVADKRNIPIQSSPELVTVVVSLLSTDCSSFVAPSASLTYSNTAVPIG
jgi:hypothetical protein